MKAGLKRKIRGAARWAALSVFLLGAAPHGVAAQHQDSEAPVCVAKADGAGGILGFIVRPSDAASFESAGFERMPCPESFEQAATTLADRCVRMRALDESGKQTVRETYGLSVEEMCAATDAWVQSLSAG